MHTRRNPGFKMAAVHAKDKMDNSLEKGSSFTFCIFSIRYIILLLLFVKKDRKLIGIEHIRKQCYGVGETNEKVFIQKI